MVVMSSRKRNSGRKRKKSTGGAGLSSKRRGPLFRQSMRTIEKKKVRSVEWLKKRTCAGVGTTG